MNSVFVMDACALIAVLANEKGADTVKGIMQKAANGEASIIMNKLNLLEVYYDVYRKYGIKAARDFLQTVQSTPLRIHSEISDDIFREAGRLKATHKISLADSIALAEAITSGGFLLTSDHHEFGAIENAEKLNIYWIR